MLRRACSASRICSSSTSPRYAASAETVGEDPSRSVSTSAALSTRSDRSSRSRGGRTDQPVSRK